MSSKRWFIVVGVLLALAAGLAGFRVALNHTPTFYATALERHADPQERREQAKRFVQTTMQLVEDIRHAERWAEEFSEDQVNAWLAAELHQKYADWLPPGVREPRVRFAENCLELAFQYEKTKWHGVVNCKLRPWVAGPRQLALEIQSLRAGLLPIPLDDVLQEISTELQNVGCRIEWKQNAGHDVLLVNFDGDEADRPQLDAIQLRPQTLLISGRRDVEEITRK